jgi:sigma-B regulation protein RsbU (phosphoserine phosphatase)
LVEGQVSLVNVLRTQLESQGHTVEAVSDGLEALMKIKTFDPDLIISDWGSDSLSGLDLCRRLRAHTRHRHIYFLLLTSRDQLQDRLEALQAGVDSHVVKPVVDQELVERVQLGLRIARLQRELAATNSQLSQSLAHKENDLEVVGKIQRSLLPGDLPNTHLRCSVVYTPCEECGGDYYDFLSLNDSKTAVVVADVSGHGAPAMVAMAIIRSLVHTFVPEAETPADSLSVINRALWNHLPTDQYATMFLGHWDQSQRTLRYSTAGHCSPLVIRREGVVESLPECQGFPLKLVGRNITYEVAEAALTPGDRLALFTDGVIECFDESGVQFGFERLTGVLRRHAADSLEELGAAVVESLMDFSGSRPWDDDLTLVLLEIQ